jgi:hypothetical protein
MSYARHLAEVGLAHSGEHQLRYGDPLSRVRQAMQADLRSAMKTRDTVVVSVLRTALAAISNAEAVDESDYPPLPPGQSRGDVPRRQLTDADIESILNREIGEVRDAAGDYRRHNELDKAGELERRIAVLARYLP